MKPAVPAAVIAALLCGAVLTGQAPAIQFADVTAASGVKFRHNAARALPATQVEALCAAVQRIDTAQNVRQLAAALRVDG